MADSIRSEPTGNGTIAKHFPSNIIGTVLSGVASQRSGAEETQTYSKMAASQQRDIRCQVSCHKVYQYCQILPTFFFF